MKRIPHTPTLLVLNELLHFAIEEIKHESKKKEYNKQDCRIWFSLLTPPKRRKILKKAHKEYLKEEKLKTN